MEMLEFPEGWSGITCCMGTLLHVIKDICAEATAIHCHGHPTNRPPFITDTATATATVTHHHKQPTIKHPNCYHTFFVITHN